MQIVRIYKNIKKIQGVWKREKVTIRYNNPIRNREPGYFNSDSPRPERGRVIPYPGFLRL